jgi:hypothetical protein
MGTPDLEKMNSSSYLLCEACGGYHPEEECEIVVVKIVKGKKCKLNVAKEYTSNLSKQSATATEKHTPEKKAVITPEETTPVAQPTPPKRSTVIPPGLASMMIPPTSPQFETKGKKEIRRA